MGKCGIGKVRNESVCVCVGVGVRMAVGVCVCVGAGELGSVWLVHMYVGNHVCVGACGGVCVRESERERERERVRVREVDGGDGGEEESSFEVISCTQQKTFKKPLHEKRQGHKTPLVYFSYRDQPDSEILVAINFFNNFLLFLIDQQFDGRFQPRDVYYSFIIVSCLGHEQICINSWRSRR